jgi:hypothetical protein
VRLAIQEVASVSRNTKIQYQRWYFVLTSVTLMFSHWSRDDGQLQLTIIDDDESDDKQRFTADGNLNLKLNSTASGGPHTDWAEISALLNP